MRIGLLGAGRIGALHARTLRNTPGVDELIVADMDAGRAAAVAADVDAASATVDEAIARADALVIASPTPTHASLIRRAVEAGRPAFCEKPLAGDLAETIDLVAQIEASGLPFQLGFQRRFDAGYREARRLVDSGDLGTLYAIRLAGHDPAPPPDDYIPLSGGLFRDFSIHDFDILRWLTGNEVEEVYADGAVRGFPVFAAHGDVDTAVLTLRLHDGPLVAMTMARHDPLGYDVRAELFGSRDSVAVGMGPRMPLRSVEPGVPGPGTNPWATFLVRFADAYAAELTTFVEVAAGRVPSPCTAADGLAALRIAEAATRSLHEHRPVPLAEVAGAAQREGSGNRSSAAAGA